MIQVTTGKRHRQRSDSATVSSLTAGPTSSRAILGKEGRHGGAMLRLWDVGEEGAAGAGGEEEVGRGQRARMASSDGELACDGRWLRRSLLSSRYSGRIWSGHRSIDSPRDELLCHGGCLLLLRRRRDPAAGEVNDRRRRIRPLEKEPATSGRHELARKRRGGPAHASASPDSMLISRRAGGAEAGEAAAMPDSAIWSWREHVTNPSSWTCRDQILLFGLRDGANGSSNGCS
jgi:hypothetical protein